MAEANAEVTTNPEAAAHTSGLHISIKAEPVTYIFGFPITNSMILSFLVLIVFFLIGMYYSKQIVSKKKGKFFYIIHFMVNYLYTFFKGIMGKDIGRFLAVLLAMFFYVLLNNWSALLPGVGSILVGEVPVLRGNSADLNATLGLAIIAFLLIQYYGIKYNGLSYFRKFVDFRNPINFFTGILEIISEFSKIISFSFRLFGNIFAGEVLLVVIAFLIPVFATFPFLLLEVFVGLIQALVFSMLTAVFINVAIQKPH